MALGRPVDPRARASLEPLTPDYAPFEHFDRELAKINAVERTVTAREAQALDDAAWSAPRSSC